MNSSYEKPRILHLDDDKDFLNLFSIKFKKWFHITSVYRPETALQKIAMEPFDAFVTDYEMPEINGLEVIRRIKQDNIHIPVILYTAQGCEEVAREAFIHGVSDYFTKDVSDVAHKEKMVNSINKAIEKKKMEKEVARQAELFKGIIDSLDNSAISIVDSGGKHIHAWSDLSVSETLGFFPHEMIGKTCRELFPGEEAVRMEQVIEKVISTGEQTRLEYFLPTSEGGVWHESKQSPVRNEHGEIIAVANFVKDITSRKRVEEKLETREKKLKALMTQIYNQTKETVDILNECIEFLEGQKHFSENDLKKMCLHRARKQLGKLNETLSILNNIV